MTSPTSERERLLQQVDDLLLEILKPVIRAIVNDVDPTALAAHGTERVTDFILKEQRSLLDKVEAATGWCSVKDVMPNEGDYVIGRLEWHSGKEVYAVLQHKTLEDNAPWLYEDGELDFWVNVTHWKPLAQLRKEIG